MTTERDPSDIICRESGKVRVISRLCDTCVFRPGNLMNLRAGRLKRIIDANLETGSLLTCHQTLPCGDNPNFGPAACNGFWEKYGLRTAAGIIAKITLGIVAVDPPEGKDDSSSDDSDQRTS